MPDVPPHLPETGPVELELLTALDAAGLPAGPGETLDTYRARLQERRRLLEQLDQDLEKHQEVTVFESVKVSATDRIPNEIIAEAAEITEPLYGFSVHQFPGFFLSRDVGLLWGGCLISDTEMPLAVFFIRASFRKKHRFFIYNRRELLAHELCHSFRQELRDIALEEFFAYQTSPSWLRRYLGNCFIRQRDALFFTIPALLLMTVQVLQSFVWPHFPVWPFWLPALGYPCWLLLRNALSRREYFRAYRKLAAFGVTNPRAVLFRLTGGERRAIAAMREQTELKAMTDAAAAAGEIRWQVIQHRFFKPLPAKGESACN